MKNARRVPGVCLAARTQPWLLGVAGAFAAGALAAGVAAGAAGALEDAAGAAGPVSFKQLPAPQNRLELVFPLFPLKKKKNNSLVCVLVA
ncbi:hypothetical protein, partial [Pseudomonas aeruginosa]|uniref:hypothetical protein n=1 Tax=Pseudomonas aeruginosa TaxID=287 RepID=UPI001C1FFF84